MAQGNGLSRREFIKSILASFWAAVLVACGADTSDQPPAPTNTPHPTSTQAPTETATSTPTQTNTPTPSATPTETPIPCFTLLEPIDGAEIDRTIGQIAFAWTEQFGAASYRFEVTIPSGYVETKEVVEPGFERYLESFPLGGEYTWVVEALNANGELICVAGPFRFSKPEYVNRDNDNQQDDGDSVGTGGVTTGSTSGDGEE